jgi:predicted transcriptional regulator
VAPGSRIWLYTKSPQAHISACASVEDIVTGTPKAIWRKYGDEVGISLEQFDTYFEGASSACAILLENVQPVAPALTLGELRSKLSSFHPPQFFKKLHKGSPELLLLRSYME